MPYLLAGTDAIEFHDYFSIWNKPVVAEISLYADPPLPALNRGPGWECRKRENSPFPIFPERGGGGGSVQRLRTHLLSEYWRQYFLFVCFTLDGKYIAQIAGSCFEGGYPRYAVISNTG